MPIFMTVGQCLTVVTLFRNNTVFSECVLTVALGRTE